MPICFWCGQEKNEIALLGKLKYDAEAPRNCIIDYKPCDKCKANMDLGCTVIEVTTTPNERTDKEIQEGLYPTGSFSVLKPEAFKRIFNSDAKMCFLDREVYQKLFKKEND